MPEDSFAPIVLDPSTASVSGPMAGLPPMPQAAPAPVTTIPVVQAAPTAVSTPVPMAAAPQQPIQAPTQQTVPLQPVPRVAEPAVVAPAPVAPPMSVAAPAPVAVAPVVPAANPVPSVAASRQAELHQQLESLTQEESKLLGTIKDWVAWIQGAETKKQALERELAVMNGQGQVTGAALNALPSVAPGLDRAVTEKQLREAEAKMKTVQDQQKIEEKKAFDNYSAGGINREGLLQEMDRISNFYATPVQEARTKITALQTQLSPASAQAAVSPVAPVVTAQPQLVTPTQPAAQPVLQTAPNATPAPAPVATAAPVTMPAPAQATAPQFQKILQRLSTLSAAQTGYIKQLLVDLPAQGTGLTVERAADGNGIIILAGTEQAYTLGHHFPDADLILSGLGADDVAALPTGTLTGSQITPPATVSL